MRFKLRKMAFPSRCCEASSWSRRDLMHVVMMASQVPPPSTSLRLALRCPRQRCRACTSHKIESFRSYLPHALHRSMTLVKVRNGIAKREDSETPDLISKYDQHEQQRKTQKTKRQNTVSTKRKGRMTASIHRKLETALFGSKASQRTFSSFIKETLA